MLMWIRINKMELNPEKTEKILLGKADALEEADLFRLDGGRYPLS